MQQPIKWTSSAGPRQTKQVKEALNRVEWEGRRHDEISIDFRGEVFHRELTQLCGGDRPEAAVELAAIADKHGRTITRDNCRAIIADCAEAEARLRSTRPVIDTRPAPASAAVAA